MSVQTTWLNHADTVLKHLMTPLSYYKGLMSDNQYAVFERARSLGNNSTWYSHNMTMDACAYIMSFVDIKSKEMEVSRSIAQDAKRGHVWTETEKAATMERMIREACSDWKDKVAKLISIVNPGNGPRFLPLCKEIHKRLRSADRKKRFEVTSIGLERARLFSGAALKADLRCKLLEVHYGSEEEKLKYHHPRMNAEKEMRVWLQQWSMWCYIEHQGCLLVQDLCSRVYDMGAYADRSYTKEEVVERFNVLYKKHVEELSFAVGGLVWNQDKLRTHGLRDQWKKRTKRVVTRFFIHQGTEPDSPFTYFPGAMASWMTTESANSMYPGEYPPPGGRPMTSREAKACSWCMELEGWTEVPHAGSLIPRLGRDTEDAWMAKLRDPDEVHAKALEDILKVEPTYDGKKPIVRQDKRLPQSEAKQFKVRDLASDMPSASRILFTDRRKESTGTPSRPSQTPHPNTSGQPIHLAIQSAAGITTKTLFPYVCRSFFLSVT